MKRKSRKQLLERIEELERELCDLKAVERLNTVIKEHNLPKCESNLCRSCIHCALYEWYPGHHAIIGCRRDIDCSSYKPKVLYLLEESRAVPQLYPPRL